MDENDPKGKSIAVKSDSEGDGQNETTESTSTTKTSNTEKKSKRKRMKEAITGKLASSKESDDKTMQDALDGLSSEQITKLLEMNPALAELLQNGDSRPSGSDANSVANPFKNLSLQEIMTGLTLNGKNAQDMGGHKFWSTQPVPKYDENVGNKAPIQEGPIKIQTVDDIPKEPAPMLQGFEWCAVDIAKDEELREVCDLLSGHYVEDDDSSLRLCYTASLLRWAMMPPGWKKDWHVGVRVSSNKKLVAFISAVPLDLRVRENIFRASEVNLLVVHKKLRSKRLAPTLIKEVTRRCNLDGIFQAIYTGGNVLPTPVSTCRYYHRPINWQKLYDVGFSNLPAHSTRASQIRKFALPEHTSLKGLRDMKETDVDSVHSLLTRYLKKYDLAMDFSKKDIEHWLVHEKKHDQLEEQVVWSFVVEDEHGKITDCISFYCLDSSIIKESTAHKHKDVRTAYLFYYATETGLTTPIDKAALKKRLNVLVADCMIYAKRHKFDVFNALSLMDNGLFLEEQKFGGGTGSLHYYLFNYRANPIAGGVDEKFALDKENLSGIGFTML